MKPALNSTFKRGCVLWTAQLLTVMEGEHTMANFDEVLRDLEQERSRLDQASEVLGTLGGRKGRRASQPRASEQWRRHGEVRFWGDSSAVRPVVQGDPRI